MKEEKFRCKICGQVVTPAADGSCPICGAPKAMLVPVSERDEEEYDQNKRR